MNFCVGLFLFLSGLLSCAAFWNPVKRIVKVAIPYLIWSFVHVVIANLKCITNIPVAYIKAIITAGSTATMYYIFVYCQFTLLIPLIDKLARSKMYYLGFAIAPLEIILMRYLPMYLGISLNKYISLIVSVSCLGWFTYFYLGYLFGNRLLRFDWSYKKLVIAWMVSIILQILEGYIQYNIGITNCGTQLKLTSIISGILFAIISYKYIMSNETSVNTKMLGILTVLGDNSFGIYFSHLVVMAVLKRIPYYSKYVIFPANGIIATIATLICVIVGKKVLGKYSRYFAL